MKPITTLRNFLLLFFFLGTVTGSLANGNPGSPCPSATISYPGSPYCSNAGTISVTISGTGGGTYISKPGLSLNFYTGDIDPANSIPGTYTVIYTLDATAGCPEFSTTATITINNAPNASISYPNPSYCTGSGNISVSLSGDQGGTFSSSAGLSIDINTGEINCSASSPGSYTVSYTVSNSCGSYTASTDISIESTPDVSISYDNSPYCANAGIVSVTLNGIGGGTYSSSPGLSIDPTNGRIDVSASTPGTYTVYYVVSSGNCSTTASTTVTITEIPNATISYPASPYCANGGMANVAISGTTGGVFSADPGLSINSSTGAIDLAASAPGTYTVTYYIASSGCGDFTTTTDITVNAAPSASFSYPSSPYCQGSGFAVVSFTGTPGGTFSSISGLSIDPNTGTVDLAASIPGNYPVLYSITGGGCGDLYANAKLIINPSPNASISYPSSSYCNVSGIASVNLSGTGGGTFSSDPGLSLNISNGDIDLAASTPGTYTVTYTVDQNGCSFSTNTDITIDAAPSASISYSGSPYCSASGIASVNLSGTEGGTFSADPGLSLNTSNGDVDLAASTPGTYTVTYSVTTICGTFEATTDITITAAPSASISYDGSPYCSNGGTASVNLNGTGGGIFSAVAGLSLNTSNGDVDLAASTPGTYTVTYSVDQNGCSFSTNTDITIDATPSASISYSGSPYCSASGIASVNLSGTTGGTFSASFGLILNTSNGDVDLATSSPGTYTVTYAVTTSCGTFQTTSDITINAAALASFSYDGSPYCSNEGTASVTFNGTAGGTFSAAAGLSLNTSTGDVDLGASTPGTYTVSYSVSQNGCSANASADITIVAGPNASIVYSGSPYFSNAGIASVTLTGDAGGSFSGEPGLVLDPATGDVDLAASLPGTYTVTYTLSSSAPCGLFTTTASITIVSGPVNLHQKDNGVLKVYPNPVIGRTLGLQLTNMNKGTYRVSLFNNFGIEVFAMQLQHAGGRTTKIIDIGNLANGTYELVLTGENKTIMTKHIIKY